MDNAIEQSTYMSIKEYKGLSYRGQSHPDYGHAACVPRSEER